MSEVTNVIIAFGVAEKKVEKIEQLQFVGSNGRSFNIVSVDDDSLPNGWYGGSKYLETNICIGSYNYLNLDELINHIKSLCWEDPEDVQLIVKEQHDFRFRLINVFEPQSS